MRKGRANHAEDDRVIPRSLRLIAEREKTRERCTHRRIRSPVKIKIIRGMIVTLHCSEVSLDRATLSSKVLRSISDT